jgi:tetratricopeptide (TPR) repeat protein/tRNA A-37 threonylcarbamoyl transferase component Bud32
MGSTPCPAPENLAAFVAGSLSGVTLESVAAHVDGCTDCLARVQQLDPGFDPLLAAIGRADPADPFAQEPECAEGLARLQALPGPGTQDDTPRSTGGEGVSGPGVPAGAQRYRPLHLHAKGGLGEVHLAEDAELHRRVALKRLQAQHAGHPDSQRRFLREAEITSKLEHPGVVPIHGLVADEHGQPCYAMRFIEGESFRDAIHRFHDADRDGRRDPGERNLALRQLLAQFVAVCKTLAFAHNRGVIHRDLKPGNIMLGKYGETLVVDWGLAKVVTRTEQARASGEETLPPTADRAMEGTRPGQVVGTPAYMSPEQASGAVAQLGPASDIYSLGATLYVLLTGQPPFQGANLLQKVQRGDFPRPRQVKPGVPPALEAVCVRAMAWKPEERYATALDLAADVEHWLADEPVAAYAEGWAARARRWARRHRPLVAGLAAAAVVGVLLGGLAWGWLEHQEARRREEVARLERQEARRREEVARLEGRDRQAIETALEQGEKLLRQGRLSEAEATLAQAAGRLAAGGPDDLQQRLRQTQDNLRLGKRLDEIRLEAATLVDGKWNPEKAGPAYAVAFKEHGLDVVAGEETEVVRRLAASPVKEQLVAALEHWAAWVEDNRMEARLLALARRADPDPLRNRFRDPAVWRDRHQLTRLARQADLKRLSPSLLVIVGSRLEELGGPGLELLERGQRRYSGDFWLNFELADALKMKKRARWDEAVGYYRAALAVRPGNLVVCNKLGIALEAKGDLTGAIAAYKKAIALDPKPAFTHYNLGNAQAAKKDLARAIACYKQAIALDPTHAPAHNNLGIALKAKGDLTGAIAAYKKAIALDPKYAMAHYNLGNALKAKGELDEAITAFGKAIAIEPKHAPAHTNLGVALKAKGDLKGAIAHYKAAIAIDPKDALAHQNLGKALKAKGDLKGAIAHYKAAIAIDAKYASAHKNLGAALYAKGDLDGAIAAFNKAIAIDPKDALAHGALGRALLATGRFAEARTATRKCLRLLSRADPLRNVATQQLRQCEQWLRLDAKLPTLLKEGAPPPDTTELLALAVLCQNYKKRYTAAARFYTGAFSTDHNLGDDLQRQHRYYAACAAALAAAGKGKDAANLGDKKYSRLRKQALDWLQDDLTAWTKVAEKGSAPAKAVARRTLEHWQKDSDLAGVRDKAALANLPKDEREAWGKLWAGVEALLKKVKAAK